MSIKMKRIPMVIRAFYRTGVWKRFVLKGGTSLALFYFPGFRISVDLDYVIYEDNDIYRDVDYYARFLKKVVLYR